VYFKLRARYDQDDDETRECYFYSSFVALYCSRCMLEDLQSNVGYNLSEQHVYLPTECSDRSKGSFKCRELQLLVTDHSIVRNRMLDSLAANGTLPFWGCHYITWNGTSSFVCFDGPQPYNGTGGPWYGCHTFTWNGTNYTYCADGPPVDGNWTFPWYDCQNETWNGTSYTVCFDPIPPFWWNQTYNMTGNLPSTRRSKLVEPVGYRVNAWRWEIPSI